MKEGERESVETTLGGRGAKLKVKRKIEEKKARDFCSHIIFKKYQKLYKSGLVLYNRLTSK